MTQELADLRQSIVSGHYDEALVIIDELEEMSKKAILRTLRSYLIRLMSHLIKNQVEQRLTNSWAASIRHSLRELQDLNLTDNRTSHYLQPADWAALIEDTFEDAVYMAAAETFEGTYSPPDLLARLDRQHICAISLTMLPDTYHTTRQELSERVNAHLATLPGGDAWQT